jgi:spermidine/putrescine transport system substrate-binding protein
MQKPENGGIFAVNTGYNSVVTGAEKFTDKNYQRNFEETYPGDALNRLWFQLEERPWFIAKRQEFATKLQAA